ncbi:hypothetical protein [Streptomyces sp. NPDC058664]|uniref:hypothetical protein n=1 Tax=unclassified Streptomyces TaxID=2593676 RepID=UPI00366A0D38
MSSEETVRVDLGDDYYVGPYVSSDPVHLDYEVPRSQLERWEAAKAAYESMQEEIEEVMEKQRERAMALALERRKARPSSVSAAIQAAYEKAITETLKQSLLLKREGK